MKDYLLLRTQTNKIYECIQDAGLDPLNFELGEESSEVGSEYKPVSTYPVSIVRYLHTDFYFKFDRSPFEDFFCKSHPSTRDLTIKSPSYKFDWEGALVSFREWLLRLKEQEVPDLWEQLEEYAPDETFFNIEELSNVPFSNYEAEKVTASLDKLHIDIKINFNLNARRSLFVERRIEYLKEASNRLGRKDWMHIAIVVIMHIAVSLALSPDKAKLLWDFVRSCFTGILQLRAP